MDHGQCLTEETLTDYLEGGLDPAIKAASEVHLLGCEACRSRLGFYMRLLNEDMSPEETTAIESFTVEWEKKRNERIARYTGGWRRRLLSITAVAAALIMGVVSVRFVINRVS